MYIQGVYFLCTMKNTIYPLKPNYTGPTKGWFAWLHHDTVLEWSDNVIERTDYVFKNKPKHEMKARTEHMIVIPDEFIPKFLEKAWEAWEKARGEAWEAGEKARGAREAEEKAWEAREEALDKAWEARENAQEAWEKTWEKAAKNPRIIKYLKENTPYAWSESNSTLIYDY